MRYADIHKMNISDGPGIGVSLYVQGCALHCPGCFNEGTWDFDGGKEYTNDTMDVILDLLKPEWMTRLSILGGEPLCPTNYKELVKLTYLAHEENKDKPNFKVWLWTGRTYENLMAEINSEPDRKHPHPLELVLKGVDYLVDGPFIQDKKDLTLKWRGSSNQRIIALNGNEEIGQ